MNQIKRLISQLSLSTLDQIWIEWQALLERSVLRGRYPDSAPKEKKLTEEQLIQLLTDRHALVEMYRSISHYEREVLHYFLFQVGEEMVTLRKAQTAPILKPALFRLGVTGLVRKGIIYTMRRPWGETAYYMPAEIRLAVYQAYLDVHRIELWEQSATPASRERASLPSVAVDLFWLAHLWRRRESCSLPLSSSQRIDKRLLHSWLSLLPDREGYLVSLPLDTDPALTKQLAVLLDFMTQERLVKWFTSLVQLDLKRTEQWLQQSREEMSRRFLLYWLGVYRSGEPWIQRYVNDMLLWFNRREERFSWVYLLSPLEVWEEEYPLPPVKEIIYRLEREVILPLVGWGLVEYAETDQGEKIWRFRPQEEYRGPWFVQDTEVLVPESTPFYHLWRLTQFLTLDRWQEMLVLKLDWNSLQHGGRADHLHSWLKWLEEHSLSPLPPLFKEQLQHWLASSQQVKLSEMTVLEIEDDALAKALLRMEELSSFQLRLVTPHLLLAKKGCWPELTQLLAQKGISCLIEGLDKGNERGEPLQPQWVHLDTSPLQDSRVVDTFPEYEAAIPAWEELPDTWKKHFISYHANTKRKIIQQAVSHQLKLKIEDDRGQVRIIEAEECKTEDGEWVLYDTRGEAYKINQLQRLQLLFPL